MDINVNSGSQDWDIAAAKAILADTDVDRDIVRLDCSVRASHCLLRSYFSLRASTIL